MSAPILTFTDPPCPLTPDLRIDIAERRAEGHTWSTIELALRFRVSTLRPAVEADPQFPAALEAARDEAAWDAEADALKRLRRLTHSDDDGVARRAAEVLLTHARERRRDATRMAVEKLRAEARQARAAARTSRKEEAGGEWPPPVVYPRQTAADRAELRERHAMEGSTKPNANVYLWGGKHPICYSVPPDESDTRVRVEVDCSIGGPPVYWVVPPDARGIGDEGCGAIFPPGSGPLAPQL